MVTNQEMQEFFQREFPQATFHIEAFGGRAATIRHPVTFDDLRPGGTVSGPTLMAVADCALYVAILGELGLVALAVTTSLTINFLHKPVADQDIVGECKLLKVGKTLATGEVSLYSVGKSDPVAHAVGTYSIPPRKS